MSIEALDALRSDLPDLFADRQLPEDWLDDWVFTKVESVTSDVLEIGAIPSEEESLIRVDTDFPVANIAIPDFPGEPFPGAPVTSTGAHLPPPDTFAFYLPFHYFHPTWWGIYLSVEGILWLRDWIYRNDPSIDLWDAASVARHFLYGHEFFHHRTEVYATRLEIIHRTYHYREEIEQAYQQTIGTDYCTEEAAANSYAYQFVADRVLKQDPQKRRSALEVLKKYIAQSPEGYRVARDYLTKPLAKAIESKLAEEYFAATTPGLRPISAASWQTFPHAFTGLTNKNSSINYFLPKSSRLLARVPTLGRLISYPKLVKKLKKLGCTFDGKGKGSHEKWRGPKNDPFILPRHPGDLKQGTVRGALKQAGIELSISELTVV